MKNLSELSDEQQAEVKRRLRESFGALTEAQAVEIVLAQTAHEEEAAQAATKKKSKKAEQAEPKDSGEAKTEPAK